MIYKQFSSLFKSDIVIILISGTNIGQGFYQLFIQNLALPRSRSRLDPILGSTLAQLNEFYLPDIPTAQELNIQFEANLNEISRLRTLSGKVDYTLFCGPPWFTEYSKFRAIRLNTVFAWLICSKPAPGGLMSCDISIVEAKHRGGFGNGATQLLAYLSIVVSARQGAKKITHIMYGLVTF